MAFVLELQPSLDPNRIAQRRSILRLRLAEVARHRAWRDGEMAVGEPRLRVCSNEAGGIGRWRYAGAGDVAYDYYCMLPSQVVFDQGDHGDWSRTRRDAMALWRTLDGWNIRYLAALTGGKGIHTEVFLHPFEADRLGIHAHRKAFATAAMGVTSDRINDEIEARLMLPTLSSTEEVESDPRLHAPNEDSRMVREYGSRGKGGKSPFVKTLWGMGPGPLRALPETREAAYRQAGVVFPEYLPLNEAPPSASHAMLREWFGGVCPIGPSCFPGAEESEPGFCSECPANH
jgi:hypothetical protein